MQQIAKENGGKCLSKKYNGIGNLHEWVCKEGHIFTMSPQYMKRGHWCPQCKKIKYQDGILKRLQDCAESQGGKCLSEKFVKFHAKIKFECNKGHIWDALPQHILYWSWCLECSKNRRSINIERLQELATKKNGKCLSEEIIDKNSLLNWECEHGHVWQSKAVNIIKGGWCPICNNSKKLIKIEQTLEILKNKGGKIISGDCRNISNRVLLQCEKGHIWKWKLERIYKGDWCKECIKEDTIKDIKEIIRKKNIKLLTEDINNSKAIELQCENNHRWKISHPYLMKVTYCRKCNSEKNFHSIKELHELAAKHNGKCLSENYINNITPIKMQCEKGHIWKTRPRNLFNGGWCRKCKLNNITIDDINNLAAEKKGKCLIENIKDLKTRLLWQCEKEHQWRDTYSSVLNGAWCKKCNSGKKFHSIKEVQEIAAKNRGECLSDKYINNVKPLQMQCELGHIWYASPRSLFRGNWCPECRKGDITMEEVMNLATKRNGKCLTEKITNIHMAILWECEKKHKWITSIKNLLFGNWCPECSKTKEKIEG